MKCLSREEMQLFFDKEVDHALEIEIQSHLKNCEKCSSLYSEVVKDMTLINNILNIAGSAGETGIIPEFKHPVIKRKKSISLRFIAVLAAAVFVGFIFLFRLDKESALAKIPESEILMYDFYEGKDLNKLWHDKSQIIIIQDEKGNVIQSIITY
jgi:hypothetical protein